MGNEDYGESSQQNDDDLERPLKKAKYVWQVKGKYHLKANYEPKSEPKLEPGKEKRACDCTEQNTGEERKCIDKFLAKTESFLDSDDDEIFTKNIDKSISTEIPITLVSPNPQNQDYYLRKWQARQIARGYIDNTINKVLENWSSAPFDVEDFVENCESDGRIENQGILMAIEAHGLQSNQPKKESSLSFLRPDELADKALDKIDTARSQIIIEGLGLGEIQENASAVDPELEVQLGLGVEYPVSVLNAAILVAIERKGLSSNK